MSRIQKNPMDLSGSELYAYLNSGQYITPSTRKQLQQKLDFDRKSNRFSALDEFYTMISTTNKKKTQKEKIPEYPELCKKISKAEETNKKSLGKNFIDFTSITEENISEKSSHSTSHMEQVNTIIVGNELILSFFDIEKMIKDFSVNRIIMQYYSIRRKIRNLNLLSKINPSKGQLFKILFMFENLKKQKKQLKKYVNIFQGLAQLRKKYCDDDFLSILLNYNSNENQIISNKMRKIFNKISYIIQLIKDTSPKYEAVVKEYFQFAFDIMDHKYNTNSIVHSLTDESQRICDEILLTMINIAADVTLDFDCDYCVYIQSSSNEPANPILVKDGISTWTYICHDEEITTELEFVDELIDSHKLSDITFEELQLFFKKMIKHEDSHYIHIRFNDRKPRNININFYISEQQIPRSKVFIKINDLPKNAMVLTSIIHNHDLVEQLKVPIIVPKNNKLNVWLTQKYRSHHHNSCYKLSKKEYDALDSSWKNSYTLIDTHKNSFTVNYLFNQLLLEDKDNTYVKPEMLKSFKKLAFNTSKKTI